MEPKQITKYLKDVDLVGPGFLAAGKDPLAVLNKKMFPLLDALWDEFGPYTVNDWFYGGVKKESGYRAPESTTGAKKSQHKEGAGFDLKFKKYTPVQVYNMILKNQAKWLALGLTRMEDANKTVTWLHIDGKITGVKYIQTFAP